MTVSTVKCIFVQYPTMDRGLVGRACPGHYLPSEDLPFSLRSVLEDEDPGVMSMVDENMMTAREVANYLRLNPVNGWRTVQHWAKAGKIKFGKAGDLYRFRKADVDEFVFDRKRSKRGR